MLFAVILCLSLVGCGEPAATEPMGEVVTRVESKEHQPRPGGESIGTFEITYEDDEPVQFRVIGTDGSVRDVIKCSDGLTMDIMPVSEIYLNGSFYVRMRNSTTDNIEREYSYFDGYLERIEVYTPGLFELESVTCYNKFGRQIMHYALSRNNVEGSLHCVGGGLSNMIVTESNADCETIYTGEYDYETGVALSLKTYFYTEEKLLIGAEETTKIGNIETSELTGETKFNFPGIIKGLEDVAEYKLELIDYSGKNFCSLIYEYGRLNRDEFTVD